jgi:hypothetical protein
MSAALDDPDDALVSLSKVNHVQAIQISELLTEILALLGNRTRGRAGAPVVRASQTF